ncbi:hypothetical protein P7J26_08040 [Streptococcus suis]|uniref:Uncharacterized protein n=1 Tax=Streptococcus suis TaxID=1307 RepID=A0A4T2H486_STRSU|nr:hypothetical protein [Streptococcus suis]TII05937.1 hypothetical protein FAJ34_09780 [Streptococcus suis]
MEWFINLDNATKITLVTLFLTNIVTILTTFLNYFQKKNELQNSLEIIEKQKVEERRDSVRNLHLDIVQSFAYSAGNILTSIETPLKDSTKDRKTSFAKLSEFDKAYYNMFVLLKSDEDRKIFKKFQYQVRRLAGLPKPDGVDIFEEQDEFEDAVDKYSKGFKELPLKIYNDLDDCLLICHNLVNNLLSDSE